MSTFQTIEIIWPGGITESTAVRGETADEALARIAGWPEFAGATFAHAGPATNVVEESAGSDTSAPAAADYEWLPFTVEWDDHSGVCAADAN